MLQPLSKLPFKVVITPPARRRPFSELHIIAADSSFVSYHADTEDFDTGVSEEQDARFIVEACNNHKRLIDAIRKIIASNPLNGSMDILQYGASIHEAKELLKELSAQ